MRLYSAWAAAALSLVAAGPAAAQAPHPATIEDLVGQEGFGSVRIGPDGRWVVVERQARWDSASTYRLGFFTSSLLTGLEIHQVDGSAPPRVLRDPAGAYGLLTGPFSPDGRRMVVYRLADREWRLGVLTLETAEIVWFAVTPELPRLGRTLAWRSNTELTAITRPDGTVPLVLRYGSQLQDRTEALWARAADGREASSVLIPSGSRRDERADAPPLHLSVLDASTGRERVVAEGEFFDFELSPDGAHAAVLRNAEDLQIGLDEPAHTGTPTRRRRLVVVDLATGRSEEPLPTHDFLSHLLAWSPDSSRLLAFARSDTDREFIDGDFWILKIGGDPRSVALGAAVPWIDRSRDGIPLARGGWDGEAVVVQVRDEGGARVWSRPGVPGVADLVVREPGETLGRIDAGAVIVRSDGRYALDGRLAAAGRGGDAGRAPDGGDRTGVNPEPREAAARPLMDLAGCISPRTDGAPICLPSLSPDETVQSVGADGSAAVVRRRRAGGSTELVLHTREGPRSLGRINAALEDRTWGDILPIPHADPAGAPLTSWLLLPPGAPAGTPPPLVVLVYPGASYAAPPSFLQAGLNPKHINPSLIAAAGFAVLAVSLPEGEIPARRDDLAARILDVVDRAASSGRIDGARVALVGHSFGAYGALLAATQTDRFAAVVASNGYADLSRSIEPFPLYRVSPDDGVLYNPMAAWAETGQAQVGLPFASDPQAFVDRSPLYAVSRLTTPTLLIESDLDGSRLGSMFSALYRANREAALLTYFGEGHAYVSPANLIDLHHNIMVWLNRYLRPAPHGEALRPSTRPDFQDGEDQKAVAGRVPDQPGLVEPGVHVFGVQ